MDTPTSAPDKFFMCEDDGSNWPAYKDVTLVRVQRHKGFTRHLRGTARKPVEIYERDGKWCKVGDESRTALSDEEVDALEDARDQYEQREASIRSIIYSTVSPSTLLEIKNQPTAADVWRALCRKFEDPGMRDLLLERLRLKKCGESDDVRYHVLQMQELFKHLELAGDGLSDQEKILYIQYSLPQDYAESVKSVASEALARTGSAVDPGWLVASLGAAFHWVVGESTVPKLLTHKSAASAKSLNRRSRLLSFVGF